MRKLLFVAALFLAACSDRPTSGNSNQMLHNEIIGIDTNGLTGWFYVADSGLGTPIDSTPILTAVNFDTIALFREPSGNRELYGLNIVFDKEGTEQFAIATQKAIGKKLAFLLFGKMVMAPEVMAQISSGRTMVYLDQYYTYKELQQVTEILKRKR